MDADEQESIRLAFAASGIEIIQDAAESVAKLTEDLEKNSEAATKVAESTEELKQAEAAALDVLKKQSTVVQELEEKIRRLKDENAALAETRKAGLVTEEAYADRSGQYIKLISESETILKRLTVVEREEAAVMAAMEEAISKSKRVEELNLIREKEVALKQEIAAEKELEAAAYRVSRAIAEETAGSMPTKRR